MAEEQNTPQEPPGADVSDEYTVTGPVDHPGGPDAQDATEHGDSHDTGSDEHDLDPRDRKYRARLRDTEAQLAQVTDQLEAAHRQLVDGYVRRCGVLPDAFWASGVELSTLVDETGTVDTAKIDEQIAATRERFGIPKAPKPHPAQGNDEARLKPNAWRQAFQPHS